MRNPSAVTDRPLTTEPRRSIVGLALVAVLLSWASAFVGIRATAPHLGPAPLALGRLLLAAPILAGLLRRSRRADRRPIGSSTRRMVVLYGVAWFAAYNVALNLSGRYIDAGTASMLVNVGPLIVAVLAGALLDEGYPSTLLVGLGVSVVGVVLIGSSSRVEGVSIAGVLLALLAAGLYATGVLSQKVALGEIDPAEATLAGTVVGIVVLVPFLPALVRDLLDAPRAATLWLCYLGAVPTALGFSMWSFVLRHSTAGRTASATLAIPGIAVFISWLLLDEVPPPQTILGGAITLVGVAVGRGLVTIPTPGRSTADD